MCICIILRVNTFATGHVTLQITQNNDNPEEGRVGLFTPAQITYNAYNTCPNLEVLNL